MDALYYVVSFLVIINIIVFVHEYGHYSAARSIGVGISTFSIGMGPEVFGFTDKNGTRWRCSLFPVGGYVMMLGDGDIASGTEDEKSLDGLSEQEKSKSITRKSAWEKMYVAFMGPLFNYIYAIAVIVLMSFFYGYPVQRTHVGMVMENSPAAKVGIAKGDRILSIDGKEVKKFQDVLIAISENNSDHLNIVIERNNETKTFSVIPEIQKYRTWFGGTKSRKLIGIASGTPVFEKRPFVESVRLAFSECISSTKEMCHVFGKLFSGKQSIDNFGGIVRMGQIAGDLSKSGNFAMLIVFTVVLSLNLGFINLFPLPVLDGGRILICFVEKIAGRKFNEKAQEYIMIVCAVLLISLMILMTINDIMRVETINKFVMKFVR